MSPHRDMLRVRIWSCGFWPDRSNSLANSRGPTGESAPPRQRTEPSRLVRVLGLSGVFGLGILTLAASNNVSTIPISPECTLHLVDFSVNPKDDLAMVSDRTDPTLNVGFAKFRRLGGPIGNPTIGFTPDVYGFNEAWLPNSSIVFRAQSHPAKRGLPFNDNQASAWSVTAEDNTGTWSFPFVAGSANAGQEVDDPVAGGLTTPQLMPVGNNVPEMFACAGARSDDGAIRTTTLFEFMAPSPLRPSGPVPPGGPPPGRPIPIQDLLSGDDHFQTNISGQPLSGTGHATPPTPTITGRPGNPINQGAVQCAMLQSDDDTSTRELHMIGVSGGRLYHATATGWGTATQWNGITFNRFNTVSQWNDVNQRLGGAFTNIVAATLVPIRPQALSVLFVAQTPDGHFKLIHAVRVSPGGTWTNPDDVFAMSGLTGAGTNTGFVRSIQVAAGMCPAYQPPAPTQDKDLVYVTWTPDGTILTGSYAAIARQWTPLLTGNYSPVVDLSRLISRSTDPTRMDTVNAMSVSTRPFPDNATPPP